MHGDRQWRDALVVSRASAAVSALDGWTQLWIWTAAERCRGSSSWATAAHPSDPGEAQWCRVRLPYSRLWVLLRRYFCVAGLRNSTRRAVVEPVTRHAFTWSIRSVDTSTLLFCIVENISVMHGVARVHVCTAVYKHFGGSVVSPPACFSVALALVQQQRIAALHTILL